MPKKRRRKGDSRDDVEDFQMTNIDFNPPPSVPIATSSTSTMINISQWDIVGDRIHGTTALASIDDPTAVAAPSATDLLATTQATSSATNSTARATFDNDVEVESTFCDVDEDDPAATGRRHFLSVSHFRLTSIVIT
jgi:hypothetical protein